MSTPTFDTLVDEAIKEADLLALAIATGTLTTSKRNAVPAPHVGSYILNVRKIRGSVNDHLVIHGRITRIDKKLGAYENTRYLGRIDGKLGWITKIIEPSQAIPRIHNGIILLTVDGTEKPVPAIFDGNQGAYRLLTVESRHDTQPAWVTLDQITSWRHAKVVAA